MTSSARRCGKLAVMQLGLWANRTTVIGPPHLMAAGRASTRICWFIALVSVTVVAVLHVAFSIRDYLHSPVSSTMAMDAAPVEFPSVTFCSLKPASEFIIRYLSSKLDRYLDYEWDYFDNWFTNQRLKRENETFDAYLKRIKLILHQMLEVMWISGRLRILGLLKNSFILDCSFNGYNCTANFTLVQHPRNWNCYTFTPPEHMKFSNPAGADLAAGLAVTFFADSDFRRRSNSRQFHRQQHAQDYRTKGMSLRQFLTARGSADQVLLNEILTKDDFQTDGLFVTIHPANSYPMFHSSKIIVPSGMSSTLQLLMVEKNSLNLAASPCRKKKSDDHRKDYIVEVNGYKAALKYRSFIETSEDINHQWEQKSLWSHCGCYSHRFPFFVSNKSQLCYYAFPGHRKVPTEDLLAKIRCHDAWMDSDDNHNRRHSKAAVEPCRRVENHVYVKSIRWPSRQDIVPAALLYLATLIENDPINVHYKRSGQLNLSESGGSWQDAMASVVLKPSCKNETSWRKKNTELMKCLDTQIVMQNVIRVRVKLAFPAATVYNETVMYEDFQILSELGGILSLWLGVSVLTFFEAVEFVYLLFQSSSASFQSSSSSDASSEQDEEEV